MKTFITKGRWTTLPETADLLYFGPGEYEPGESRKPDVVIPSSTIPELIAYLDEAGYIKPRLDERLRAEDLKITHRLLDTVQRLVEKV